MLTLQSTNELNIANLTGTQRRAQPNLLDVSEENLFFKTYACAMGATLGRPFRAGCTHMAELSDLSDQEHPRCVARLHR